MPRLVLPKLSVPHIAALVQKLVADSTLNGCTQILSADNNPSQRLSFYNGSDWSADIILRDIREEEKPAVSTYSEGDAPRADRDITVDLSEIKRPLCILDANLDEDGGNGLNGTFIIDAIRAEFGGISLENDGRDPLVACSKAKSVGTLACPRFEGDRFADADMTSEANYKKGVNNIIEGSVLSLTRSLGIETSKMEHALPSLYATLQTEVNALVQTPAQHPADKIVAQDASPKQNPSSPDMTV